MKTIKFWLINSRYHTLFQSLLPGCLAFFMARNESDFSFFYGLLAILGVSIGHLGVNLVDDYFDYRKKNTLFRDDLVHEGMRARINKCGYITKGEATLNHLLVACLVFCGSALIAGLIIFLKRGEFILYLALLTAFLGFFYSCRPLHLSYRGVGELQVSLMFGPMLMSGVYYAAGGSFDLAVLFVSVPVGLLVGNILYTHSIMDAEPDKRVGKMTLAVRLKSPKNMIRVLKIFLIVPYLFVAAGIGWAYLPPSFALVLLTAPLAWVFFKMMKDFTINPNQPITRRFWMGPMNNWKRMKANNIEWFMIRWFVARNLLLFFCLSLIMANI
ncbi:MAG: prenyltransferase [Candidatus Adiutrix sp.]